MEGAFHGGYREWAQPLSSLLSVIPSISTKVRNLAKFSATFYTEEMFGFLRCCGNVLSELAQLCGSILTELVGSFLVFFFQKTIFLCHLSSAHPESTNEELQKWSERSARIAISVYGNLYKCIGFNLFVSDIWLFSAISTFFD